MRLFLQAVHAHAWENDMRLLVAKTIERSGLMEMVGQKTDLTHKG